MADALDNNALDEVVVTGVRPSIPNFLGQLPQVKLGGIGVSVILREEYSDTLRITDHPVEGGANITDHSFKEPVRVTLTCGWSNASLTALQQEVVGVFNAIASNGLSAVKARLSQLDYVSHVYAQLLDMQSSRQPIKIVTTMRLYSNMLIESLAVQRDKDTGNIIAVQAGCREVIIVNTSVTSVSQLNQALPATTADAIEGGTRSLTTGTPSVLPAAAPPAGNLSSLPW